MDASVKGSTRYLWLAVIVGCIFVLITGVAYLKFGQNSLRKSLLEECFKTSLTFTFIAVGGALVKSVIDAEADRRKAGLNAEADRRAARKAESDTRKEQQQALVRELTEIFSGFYTVRKQYHSALEVEASIDTNVLLREAVQLEGRYGGFKVQALIHLHLPLGDFGHKSVSELENKIKSEKDPDQLERLWFELLGEAFDGWRHALEKRERIDTSGKAWLGYEHILKLLMRSHLD